MIKRPMINFMKVGEYDELYTLRDVAVQFAEFYKEFYEVRTGKPLRTIWECTDFYGSEITKAFEELGVFVKRGEKDCFLIERGEVEFIDAIVTNPPYSMKNEFLEWAFRLGKPFAFLLPLSALSSIKRAELYMKHSDGMYLVFLKRRPQFMTTKKRNWFDCLWLVYFKGSGSGFTWL